MQSSESLMTLDTQVIAHAEKAWQLMHGLKLLPTPENYAVFYTFCEGQNKKLVTSVGEVLDRFQAEPAKLANAILVVYEQTLAANSREMVVEKTAESINLGLKEIMDMVASAQAGSDKYGARLNEFGEGIASAPLETIKSMVANMAAETKIMADQNKALQDQLSSKMEEVHDLQTNLHSVKQEALQDGLTGIGNRKAFTTELVRVTNEARELGETLTIVMIDIDFFKKFNDKYGHLVGDQVLKLVAHTLKENIKGRDTVARWGGEEFALLLPQTPVEFGVKLADNLRNIVAHKKIIRRPQNEDLGVITLSMGAAQYVPGEDINDFVDRADKALYQAKQGGRNRVVAAETPAHAAMPQTEAPMDRAVNITTA